MQIEGSRLIIVQGSSGHYKGPQQSFIKGMVHKYMKEALAVMQ